jgi:hypothetical protein
MLDWFSCFMEINRFLIGHQTSSGPQVCQCEDNHRRMNMAALKGGRGRGCGRWSHPSRLSLQIFIELCSVSDTVSGSAEHFGSMQ